MTFEEAFKAMREGHNVRRTGWSIVGHMNITSTQGGELYIQRYYAERLLPFTPSQIDFFAKDWEICRNEEEERASK